MNSRPRGLVILDAAAFLFVAVATYMVFVYAPIEAVMGLVQKVFYFHVSAAWLGMLGFMAAMVAGVAYLVTRKPHWDLISLSAIEIGLVFMLIAIIMGSIWARPIWNTWWTWDPRLTTATIMELVYAAYLMLRSGIEDPDRRSRFAAVYSIVGFLSVPLTFFSIRFFRTIHPVVIGSGDPSVSGTFSMTPPMGLTFAISLVAFSVLFVSLLWHRVRLGELAQRVENMRMHITQ